MPNPHVVLLNQSVLCDNLSIEYPIFKLDQGQSVIVISRKPYMSPTDSAPLPGGLAVFSINNIAPLVISFNNFVTSLAQWEIPLDNIYIYSTGKNDSQLIKDVQEFIEQQKNIQLKRSKIIPTILNTKSDDVISIDFDENNELKIEITPERKKLYASTTKTSYLGGLVSKLWSNGNSESHPTISETTTRKSPTPGKKSL